MFEEAVATVAQGAEGGGRGAPKEKGRSWGWGWRWEGCARPCAHVSTRIPRSLVMSETGHFSPPLPGDKRCLSRERFSGDVCAPFFFFA